METTLSKADLVSICLTIGCSGMSPKRCPGDPDCEIIQKIVRGGAAREADDPT